MERSKPSKRRIDALKKEAAKKKTEHQEACEFVITQACIETAEELAILWPK